MKDPLLSLLAGKRNPRVLEPWFEVRKVPKEMHEYYEKEPIGDLLLEGLTGLVEADVRLEEAKSKLAEVIDWIEGTRDGLDDARLSLEAATLRLGHAIPLPPLKKGHKPRTLRMK